MNSPMVWIRVNTSPPIAVVSHGLYLEIAEFQWHLIPLPEIYERLETSPTTGLSSDKLPQLLSQYGSNIPTPPPSRLLHKLFMYFFGGFGSLLLAGGILVLIAWKPLGNPPAPANAALGSVLLLVFAVQAGFNAWQDFSSSKVMNSIMSMLPDKCLVLRDGSQSEVLSTALVPGDILYVRLGEKIAADIRMLEVSMDLKFDRSVLTGIPPQYLDHLDGNLTGIQENRSPRQPPLIPLTRTTSKLAV